jgi:hypothetical protein
MISLIFARILFRFSSGCCLREKPLDMKVVFECARTHDKRLVECLVYKVGFHAPNCMLTVVQLFAARSSRVTSSVVFFSLHILTVRGV